MPKGEKTLPALREPRGMKRWWKARTPEAMADASSMLRAMQDLHYVALAHLMRQMTDRKVPPAVKTQIALAMSPRLNAEFKGRLSARDGARPQATEGGEESVMDAYKMRLTTGGR